MVPFISQGNDLFLMSSFHIALSLIISGDLANLPRIATKNPINLSSIMFTYTHNAGLGAIFFWALSLNISVFLTYNITKATFSTNKISWAGTAITSPAWVSALLMTPGTMPFLLIKAR